MNSESVAKLETNRAKLAAAMFAADEAGEEFVQIAIAYLENMDAIRRAKT